MTLVPLYGAFSKDMGVQWAKGLVNSAVSCGLFHRWSKEIAQWNQRTIRIRIITTR
jgi:hypothetical protein